MSVLAPSCVLLCGVKVLTLVASSTLVSTCTKRVSSGATISPTPIFLQSLPANLVDSLRSCKPMGGLLIRSCSAC